jgi:voltage-gated potassium channel
MKKLLRNALENTGSKSFIIVNDILAFFTIASVLSIVLESVVSLQGYQALFTFVEYSSVIIFTTEYIARLIITRPVTKYVFGFYGIIDFLAIVPSFFGLANLTFLKTVRMLRILRFLRVLRLTKFVRNTTQKVKKTDQKAQLHVINVEIYFLAFFSAVVFFGSLIYLVEGHQAYATNIPIGMLWAARSLLGIPPPPVDTLSGEFVVICTRFISYILLGLLIHVVGNTVSRFLFGSEDVGE